MTRTFAQVLVARGRVRIADIEEATLRQVVQGGTLDTLLLEMGAADENELLGALAETHELRALSKADIDLVPPHIPRLFPLPFAEAYHLVPFELQGDHLGVIIDGAPDKEIFARIHERLRLQVEAVVTTEARLHYAMNQLYGATLLPRFRTIIAKLDGTTMVSEPGRGDDSEVLSWGVSGAKIRSAAGEGRVVNMRDLLGRLEVAADRDGIIELLLQACVAFFDHAALFLLQGGRFNGWRGTSPESTQRVARTSIPVESPSVLRTVHDTRSHYLGPVPSNSTNQGMLADMGRRTPRAALLAPIMVGQHLTIVLYADNGRRGISPKRVAATLLLTHRVGLALERLIRKRKTTPAKLPSATGPEDTRLEFGSIDGAGNVYQLSDEDLELLDGDETLATEVVLDDGPPQDNEFEIDVEPDADDADDKDDATSWDEVSFDGLDESSEGKRAAFEKTLEAHVERAGADDSATDDGDDGYVAFAGVESGEESLDDWEDVLVDAAEASAAANKRKEREVRGASPTVTWDHVIAEAASAAQIVPRTDNVVPMAGAAVQEHDMLLDGLEAADPERRTHALERILALGGELDGVLHERFPGAIQFDPLTTTARLPPFAECSGICALAARRGAGAAGLVLPHLDSADAGRRFFAAYFLLAVRCPEALELLARRLYDREPRIRYLAAEALRQYAGDPAYGRVLDSARAQLKVPVLDSQVSAVQVLGQLRDAASVPLLIPLVVAPAKPLAQASVSALTVICAQGFGYDVARWADWWRASYARPRPAWLVAGLRHLDPEVRRVANTELQLLTGRTANFNPTATAAEREPATRLWESWWAQTVAKHGAAAAPTSAA